MKNKHKVSVAILEQSCVNRFGHQLHCLHPLPSMPRVSMHNFDYCDFCFESFAILSTFGYGPLTHQ